MQVRSTYRYAKISPFKVREVTRAIQGLPVSAALDLVALDEALEELAEFDPRKSRIVELRFFGGLSVEETAEVLGVSAPTVKRHWRATRAWLYGRMQNK